MQRDPDCVFCEIVSGEADAQIVYADGMVTAFMDINPVNPGHMLVIPNDHAASIRDVQDEVCGQMFVIGRDLNRALRKSDLRCEAVSMYLADGRAAGQAVFHAHLHIIPRFAGDSSGLQLHAKAPHSPGRAELREQAEGLSRALDEVQAG